MPNETQTKILDAAESLFAEKGYSATSIRDITSKAGVNLAAVNYYFRSKEALIGAVFQRLIEPVNRLRLERLEALEHRETDPLAIENILRALIEPTFAMFHEYRESKPFFMQLVGRIHTDSSETIRTLFFEHLRPVLQAFSKAISEAVPHLTRERAELRMRFIMGALAHTYLGLGPIPNPKRAPAVILEEIICFAAAGLRSESPSGHKSPNGEHRVH